MSDVRNPIGDLDKAAHAEIGKWYRAPGGLWGWLLGKNDVLMGDAQCLTDSEIVKSYRASNILRTDQFKDAIIRQAMTMDFAAHLERCVEGMGFCGGFDPYLRTIERRLQNEFNENNTRRRVGDAYDQARRFPNRCKYGAEGRRNCTCRTFPRDNRYYRRMVTWDSGG